MKVKYKGPLAEAAVSGVGIVKRGEIRKVADDLGKRLILSGSFIEILEPKRIQPKRLPPKPKRTWTPKEAKKKEPKVEPVKVEPKVEPMVEPKVEPSEEPIIEEPVPLPPREEDIEELEE